MILEVNELNVKFEIEGIKHTALNDINFTLNKRESLGFVGESGCGKSTLAYSLISLLEDNGSIENGEIKIDGIDIVKAKDKTIRQIRWRDIAIVFQNAMTALNPVEKIGKQIINALMLHEKISKKNAIKRAEELFEKVGISSERLMQYPHEFSGGMKQRAMIALALICYPKILLADEPTTALDVVAQKQVLQLLKQLQDEFDLTLIMISHDISSIAETCEKVAVMYGGEIMEIGKTNEVFLNSKHPYTQALVRSFPSIHQEIEELKQIPGYPPSLEELPKGCPFVSRCAYAQKICEIEKPKMKEFEHQSVKCHFAGKVGIENE